MDYARVKEIAEQLVLISDARENTIMLLKDREYSYDFAYNHSPNNCDTVWEPIVFKSQAAKEALVSALAIELDYQTKELTKAVSEAE